MKKTLCTLLALLMLSGLAACGGSASAPAGEPAPAAEAPAVEEPFAAEVPEVSYLVKVEDPDGYPVPGVTLQLCDDTACIRGETDEHGTAVFTARDVPCDVLVLKAPEDYVVTAEEFPVPQDTKEVLVTLQFTESYENVADFTDAFGNPIPDTFRFETRDLDGNPVRLADVVAGHRVTMFNFWTIGCKPCIQEMPGLDELNKKFEELDCQIVGVCAVGEWDKDRDTVKDIVESKGVSYFNLIAREAEKGLPSVESVPISYFVDSRGKVLAVTLPGAPDHMEEWYPPYLERALSVLEGTAEG